MADKETESKGTSLTQAYRNSPAILSCFLNLKNKSIAADIFFFFFLLEQRVGKALFSAHTPRFYYRPLLCGAGNAAVNNSVHSWKSLNLRVLQASFKCH